MYVALWHTYARTRIHDPSLQVVRVQGRRWVRQLEVSALDKLRHNSTLRELFGDFAAGA